MSPRWTPALLSAAALLGGLASAPYVTVQEGVLALAGANTATFAAAVVQKKAGSVTSRGKTLCQLMRAV